MISILRSTNLPRTTTSATATWSFQVATITDVQKLNEHLSSRTGGGSNLGAS